MRRLRVTVNDTKPPVLKAAGELDYRNCSKLERLIEDTLGRHGPSLGLALDGLDFVDSSGIRILAKAAHEAQSSGGYLNLVSLTPQLRHALEITGFQRLFQISGCTVQMEAPVITYPHTGRASSFRVPVAINAPRDVRERVCDFAACVGFSEPVMDDIKLAIGEAISNAVRHGTSDEGFIQVRCHAENDKLCVEMRYPSEVFDPDQVPVPCFDPPSEGGMGIYFMRLVMDKVDYQFADGHAVLTLEKQADNELRNE